VFHCKAEQVGILPLQDGRVRTAGSRIPNLSAGRTSFTSYPGTVGIPESNTPGLIGRS
jgi:arylsulfatase